jgi:hypothetical protein
MASHSLIMDLQHTPTNPSVTTGALVLSTFLICLDSGWFTWWLPRVARTSLLIRCWASCEMLSTLQFGTLGRSSCLQNPVQVEILLPVYAH